MIIAKKLTQKCGRILISKQFEEINPNQFEDIPPQGIRQPFYREIHEAADAEITPMKIAFIEAVAATKGALVLSRVKQALRSGNLGQIEETIGFNALENELEAAFMINLNNAFTNSAENAEGILPNELRTGIGFDVTNPRVEQFLLTRSGELITQITDESKLAIRQTLARAERQGLGIDPTAELIKQHIGLTRRQAQAVDNFRLKLEADGVKRADAVKRAETKAERMLEFRAENISRTEMIKAASAGADELFRQRIEELGIGVRDFKKVWVVTPDDRLCVHCRALTNQSQPIDGFFQSGVFRVQFPPLHPQCRCVLSYERV